VLLTVVFDTRRRPPIISLHESRRSSRGFHFRQCTLCA
jgi:hypothetical protein